MDKYFHSIDNSQHASSQIRPTSFFAHFLVSVDWLTNQFVSHVLYNPTETRYSQVGCRLYKADSFGHFQTFNIFFSCSITQDTIGLLLQWIRLRIRYGRLTAFCFYRIKLVLG